MVIQQKTEVSSPNFAVSVVTATPHDLTTTGVISICRIRVILYVFSRLTNEAYGGIIQLTEISTHQSLAEEKK